VCLSARARGADYPVRLFLGATVCLFGVAVTHHVASFLNAVFLVLWTLVEKGQSPLRVLLGRGSSSLRLPGPYQVSADSRSMDSEVLAAVAWSRDNLEPGSRISVDRVNATLFAAMAGLWPIIEFRGRNTPSLYFADDWGDKETETARILQLRYLHVDRRLAQELPLLGSYFVINETSGSRQLTDWELTKFGSVPGTGPSPSTTSKDLA
jgi:hypothetical protein